MATQSSPVRADAVQRTALNKNDHTYVEGLKDLGGALEFGANLTQELITTWASSFSAHDGLTGGKAMWFYIIHDGLSDAVAFEGDPAPLGLNEATVGSMLETTLYITPNSAPEWVSKPTVTVNGNG